MATPGITLPASGCASIFPTVATRSGVVRPRCSTRPIHSAAQASASRREFIGVVPAWLAFPLKTHIPTAEPGDCLHHAERQVEIFQHRSCSMWNSRYAFTSGSSTASGIRAGSKPNARMAANTGSSITGDPTSARLPMNGTPKRTPLLFRKRCHLHRTCGRSSTNAIAISTPRMPSNAPGLRHGIQVRADHQPGSFAPDSPQISYCIDVCFHAHGFHPAADQPVHLVHGSERKVRVVTPGSSVCCANSRHRRIISRPFNVAPHPHKQAGAVTHASAFILWSEADLQATRPWE